MSRRRRSTRRWLPVSLAVVTAALLAAILLLGGDGGEEVRAGSELLGPGPALEITRVPASYRVTYLVEGRAGGELTRNAERLTVLRPFASRIETFSGEAAEGEPGTVRVGDLGRLLFGGAAMADTVVAPPPGPAPGDLRLDTVVDDAVRAGFLERRERRRVLDRVCQVYRSSEALGAIQVLGPLDASSGEHVDSCVDEAGLLLEEVLFVRDRVLLRRVAVRVEEDPALDREMFETGDPTLGVTDGGGSLQPVEPGSAPPGEFWALDGPVPGFLDGGRYLSVPPQAEAFADPSQRSRRLGLTVDVHVAGADLVTVENGATLGGVDVFPEVPHAQRADLGELGEGEVLLTPKGPEVRVRLGAGRFVRLTGTVDRDDLVDLARRLRREEGGGLRVLGQEQT